MKPLSVFFFTLCLLGGAFRCRAETLSFSIGTNTVQVSFANSALSMTSKTALCAELHKAFAFASSPSEILLENNGGAFKLKRMPLDILPKAISSETLSFTQTNSVYMCLVSLALSEAYEEKAAMLQDHPDAIPLLDTMINAINSESFTNLTIQAKLDMFWPPNTIQSQPPKAILDELDSVLFAPVRSNVLYVPSLFAIEIGFALADENVSCSLYAHCVAKDKQTGRIQPYPVGCIHGKWRLFFGL